MSQGESSEKHEVQFYSPLFGLQYSGDVAILGGDSHAGVGLWRPDPEEWAGLEQVDVFQTYVTPEWAYGEAEVVDAIPVCIVVLFKTEFQCEEAKRRLWPVAREAETDAVITLRLFAEGDFLDPMLVGTIARCDDGMITRSPGPYRQGFYEREWPTPFTFSDEDADSFRSLMALVAHSRAVIPEPSLNIALENFRYAWATPFMNPRVRLSLLFAALEALFGRLRDEIDGVGATERVATVAVQDAEADSELTIFLKGLRKLRNQVAHGSLESANADSYIDQTGTILRRSLLAVLQFHMGPCFHETSLNADESCVKAFNRLLAQVHKGDAKARATLATVTESPLGS